jgi:hypothetical protein
MNNITAPPPIPPSGIPDSLQPLGFNPEERDPVPNLVVTVEAILRQPRRILFQLRQTGAGKVILSLFGLSLVSSLIYGLVVGSFSMGIQLWVAPLKIAGGLLLSTLICLPSLYIFACLSGSQARLLEIIGLAAGMLALGTILLIGFGPVAWLFSQSTASVCWMGALHLSFWLIAGSFGLRFLAAGFDHSKARSNAGINLWMLIFMLVVLQMSTALRPIIGKSDTIFPTEKKFFIKHWSDCLRAGN